MNAGRAAGGNTDGPQTTRNTSLADFLQNIQATKEGLRSAFRFDEKRLLDLLLNAKGKDKDLLISDPDIDDDEDQNGMYEPIRILGEGSFGCVALFQKKVDGRIVDSVALKESAFQQHLAYLDQDPELGLTKEAMFQFQLNNMEDSNTLHLRRYKYLEQQQKTRMYLEYGAHRDLSVLRRRYKAFDRYLPELFLWQVFLSLAKAVHRMEVGYPPWKIVDTMNLTESPALRSLFLLHFDVKPANVLLTEPSRAGDPTRLAENAYPQAKLADFGLADLLHQNDLGNPGDFWRQGTHFFRAPEQENWGSQWKIPPNNQKPLPGGPYTRSEARKLVRDADPHCYGVKFTPAHNIWAIGKTMSDLTFLDESDGYELLMPPEMAEEATYARIGGDMIGVRNTSFYQAFSPALRQTITACLAIEASERPSAQTLIATCQQCIRASEAQLRDFEATTGDFGRRKLFYNGNEINQMTPGNCDFAKSKALYCRLMEEANIAVDGDLKLPEKWKPIIDEVEAEHQAYGLFPPGRQPFRRENGKVVFRPDDSPSSGMPENRGAGRDDPSVLVQQDLSRRQMNRAINQLGRLIVEANGGVDELDIVDERGAIVQHEGMDELDVLEELEARRRLLLEAQLNVEVAFELWKQRNPDKVRIDANANGRPRAGHNDK